MAYGLLMETGAYDEAFTLLNSFEPTLPHELDFITVQNILLDYMDDIPNFTATQPQLDFVESVGLDRNELSGFARTVYKLLSGDILNLPQADIDDNNFLIEEVNHRSTIVEQNIVSVYPNPVTGSTINMNWDSKGISLSGLLTIRDFSGKVVLNKFVESGENSIETSQLNQGLYLISIEHKGTIIYNDKFINL